MSRSGCAGDVFARRIRRGVRLALLSVGLIAGSANGQSLNSGSLLVSESNRPSARPCPADLDNHADCYGGKDENGAYYLIAIPRQANGTLIVHAHGGPRYVGPAPDGSDADLVRFSAMVRAGYSWVGSTYRTGGYGVRMAAQDVDLSRRIFWAEFGTPALTILHGQSYGANVAAKLAELGTVDAAGNVAYHGVMLTSAAVGDRYGQLEKLVDTRVVYQFYCQNLPYPNEPPFPAWQGLPLGAAMSAEEVSLRVNQCTGADLAPAKRSAEQSHNLAAILAVTRGNREDLARTIELSTLRIQDIVGNFLKGHNPFDNMARRYKGSDDDVSLNTAVERFAGSRAARDQLYYDYQLSGLILAPTIILHARYDPVVPYNTTAEYETAIERAGRGHLLLRLPTSEDQHSKLSDSQYLAVLSAISRWVDGGNRPTPDAVANACKVHAIAGLGGCYFEN